MKRKKAGRSNLGSHKRIKSKLVAPWNSMPGNLQFTSWIEDRLPDVLWLALLRSAFSQVDALAIFRQFIDGFEYTGENKTPIPTHTFLSALAEADFDKYLEPVLASAECKAALSPLLFFENLPDRHHWVRHLEQPTDDASAISKAVFHCLDHQSQESTDIRWFSMMCMARNGKFILPQGERFQEMAKEWDEYPNYGDQRRVRPSIRAAEIAFRMEPDSKVPDWCSAFWLECWERTLCIPGERSIEQDKRRSEQHDIAALIASVEHIYREAVVHFHKTLENTKLDARHDGAFGFAFYALYLAHESLVTGAFQRAIGQIIVRVLAETVLTFSYLAKKDELALWAKYRNYGLGQLKLSFLKLIEQKDVPDFVDLNFLERLINEDFWHEHLDIELGHWAGSDLRKMSDEIGRKDVYDKYYTTTSPFVHGTWSAVRTVSFETCLNPLHRFHRIPTVPNLLFEPSFSDLKKLINLVLELLGSLYPEFKLRIHDKDMPKPPAAEEDAG